MIKTTYGKLEKLGRAAAMLLISVLVCLFVSVSSYAQNDLLLTPAIQSDKAASSLLLDIAKAGTRLVAVGERGHILCSDDNGTTWRQANVPVMVTLTAVHFPSPSQGWAVGHDGVILHTKDGGDTWAKQMDGSKVNLLNLAHAKAIVKAKEEQLANATENEKDTLAAELEDARYEAEDMEILNGEKKGCDPFLDIWFANDKEGFAIGAFGLFFHTRDGGENWTTWWDRIENMDRLHLNAFAASKNALFIAGEYGILFRSLDGGKTWKKLASPYEGSFFGIVASPDLTYVIAFGIGGKIVTSTDGGDNWDFSVTRAGAALGGGTVKKDGSVVLVSYSGLVLSGSGKTNQFKLKKIGAGWSSVVETNDDHIVLVGLMGSLRVPFNKADLGG